MYLKLKVTYHTDNVQGKVNSCISNSEGSESKNVGCTLIEVYEKTVKNYNERHNSAIHAGLRSSSEMNEDSFIRGVNLNHEINMSCSDGTGIGSCKISDWFTR